MRDTALANAPDRSPPSAHRGLFAPAGAQSLNAQPLPRLVRTHRVSEVFGPSLAYAYRAAARGDIQIKKIGRASYIVTETMLAHLASLPDFESKQSI